MLAVMRTLILTGLMGDGMTEVINYHTNDGVRRGMLIKTGRKYLQVIMMDYPLRVRKVPLAEQKYMTVLEHYPLWKCKKHFRRAAKRWHGKPGDLSKTVKQAIRGA